MPSANTEQRRLAAIMFTDLVGYSALAQRNEALALALLAESQRLLRTQFPLFNGREVKSTGDGFLVEFPSALQATQCAVEIQRAVAARNGAEPDERQIRVRIGIHVGDVVHREADMYGDGVNIAARIEPLAKGGGICLSDTVYAQVRNKLEVGLTRLDSPQLKHIDVPMDVYRVVLPWETKGEVGRQEAESGRKPRRDVPSRRADASKVTALAAIVLLAVGLGGWFVHQSGKVAKQVEASPTPPSSPSAATSPGTAPAAAPKSIAVLPFVNMSGNAENEYFSDGISEEILNALARTPGLRVAARTSAFFFKGKNEPVQKIGEALKVGVVLEGSVRRAGNQLRITAQLINVTDGYHLWSETFDRPAEDVFAIQSEVAQRVLEALKVKLLPDSGASLTQGSTGDLEAYDLFLRGRQYWNKRTGTDLERAIGYFQQATEKDPKFALAYAGLASCYGVLPWYTDMAILESIAKARAAAGRALELVPELAEAHAVLAYCFAWEGDTVRSENAYRRALACNPNYATAHQWLAELLTDSGRPQLALAEIRVAAGLDPLSATIQAGVGRMLLDNRRHDEALVQLDRTLQLSPDFPLALRVRGLVLLNQKKFPEAISNLERALELGGNYPTLASLLGYCYAATGRTNQARQQLDYLQAKFAKGLPSASSIAFIHHGFGDRGQVFAWLERAAQNPFERVRLLRYYAAWDDVTADPRYAALLKKHGLDK